MYVCNVIKKTSFSREFTHTQTNHQTQPHKSITTTSQPSNILNRNMNYSSHFRALAPSVNTPQTTFTAQVPQSVMSQTQNSINSFDNQMNKQKPTKKLSHDSTYTASTSVMTGHGHDLHHIPQASPSVPPVTDYKTLVDFEHNYPGYLSRPSVNSGQGAGTGPGLLMSPSTTTTASIDGNISDGNTEMISAGQRYSGVTQNRGAKNVSKSGQTQSSFSPTSRSLSSTAGFITPSGSALGPSCPGPTNHGPSQSYIYNNQTPCTQLDFNNHSYSTLPFNRPNISSNHTSANKTDSTSNSRYTSDLNSQTSSVSSIPPIINDNLSSAHANLSAYAVYQPHHPGNQAGNPMGPSGHAGHGPAPGSTSGYNLAYTEALTQLKEFQEKNASLTHSRRKDQNLITDLQKQNENYKKDIHKLQDNYTSLKNSYDNQRNTNKSISQQLLILKSKEEELAKENKMQKRDYKIILNERAAAHQEMSELEERNEELNKRILEKHWNTFEAILANENHGVVTDSIRNLISETITQAKTHQSKIEELTQNYENKLKARRKEFNDLLFKVNDSNEQIEIKRKADHSQLSILVQENQDLNNQVTTLKEKDRENQKFYRTSQKMLEEKNQLAVECDAIRQERDGLRIKVHNMNFDLIQASAEITNLGCKVQELKRKQMQNLNLNNQNFQNQSKLQPVHVSNDSAFMEPSSKNNCNDKKSISTSISASISADSDQKSNSKEPKELTIKIDIKNLTEAPFELSGGLAQSGDGSLVVSSISKNIKYLDDSKPLNQNDHVQRINDHDLSGSHLNSSKAKNMVKNVLESSCPELKIVVRRNRPVSSNSNSNHSQGNYSQKNFCQGQVGSSGATLPRNASSTTSMSYSPFTYNSLNSFHRDQRRSISPTGQMSSHQISSTITATLTSQQAKQLANRINKGHEIVQSVADGSNLSLNNKSFNLQGLQTGDSLVNINGQNLSSKSPNDVISILNGHGHSGNFNTNKITVKAQRKSSHLLGNNYNYKNLSSLHINAASTQIGVMGVSGVNHQMSTSSNSSMSGISKSSHANIHSGQVELELPEDRSLVYYQKQSQNYVKNFGHSGHQHQHQNHNLRANNAQGAPGNYSNPTSPIIRHNQITTNDNVFDSMSNYQSYHHHPVADGNHYHTMPHNHHPMGQTIPSSNFTRQFSTRNRSKSPINQQIMGVHGHANQANLKSPNSNESQSRNSQVNSPDIPKYIHKNTLSTITTDTVMPNSPHSRENSDESKTSKTSKNSNSTGKKSSDNSNSNKSSVKQNLTNNGGPGLTTNTGTTSTVSNLLRSNPGSGISQNLNIDPDKKLSISSMKSDSQTNRTNNCILSSNEENAANTKGCISIFSSVVQSDEKLNKTSTSVNNGSESMNTSRLRDSTSCSTYNRDSETQNASTSACNGSGNVNGQNPCGPSQTQPQKPLGFKKKITNSLLKFNKRKNSSTKSLSQSTNHDSNGNGHTNGNSSTNNSFASLHVGRKSNLIRNDSMRSSGRSERNRISGHTKNLSSSSCNPVNCGPGIGSSPGNGRRNSEHK